MRCLLLLHTDINRREEDLLPDLLLQSLNQLLVPDILLLDNKCFTLKLLIIMVRHTDNMVLILDNTLRLLIQTNISLLLQDILRLILRLILGRIRGRDNIILKEFLPLLQALIIRHQLLPFLLHLRLVIDNLFLQEIK